jgi:hypothetical protein
VKKDPVALRIREEMQLTEASVGWRLFWEQYAREHERAKVWLMGTPIHDKDGRSVAQELAYRKGFLDGVMQLGEMRTRIDDALEKGVNPFAKEDADHVF